MTKHAWYDNNYEGKALRRVFTKLLKRFEKEIEKPTTELDDLNTMAHTLTLVAKTKADLAKPENELIARVQIIEGQLGIKQKRVSGVIELK